MNYAQWGGLTSESLDAMIFVSQQERSFTRGYELKISSIDEFKKHCEGKKIVLLVSGGLDGAYWLSYISTLPINKVYALCIDVGGEPNTTLIKELCNRFNAEFILQNKVDEFCNDYIKPALLAQAIYLNAHPISASLSRPLFAKTAFEFSKDYKCDAIIHTSNSTQNSLRRYNGAFKGLKYEGIYGSPFENDNISRKEKHAFLKKHGIDFADHDVSRDSNIWCNEFESGPFDDPENIDQREDYYIWTRQIVDGATEVAIEINQGQVICINNRPTDLKAAISQLNIIVGKHGLGRYIGLEEIPTGAKVQEIREMPGAFFLLNAYRHLELGCLSDELIRHKMMLGQTWTKEAVEGRWFGELREACEAFILNTARRLNGKISFRMDRHNIKLTSLRCDKPLYIRERWS